MIKIQMDVYRRVRAWHPHNDTYAGYCETSFVYLVKLFESSVGEFHYSHITIIELTMWLAGWLTVCECGNRLLERLM